MHMCVWDIGRITHGWKDIWAIWEIYVRVSDFNYTCFHTYIIMCFKVIKVLCVCCMRESVGCLWMHTCRSVASRCVCVAQRRRGAAGEGVADAAFVAVPAAPPPSKGALLRRSVASAFQNVLVPPEKKVSLRSMAGPPGGQLLPKDTVYYTEHFHGYEAKHHFTASVIYTEREIQHQMTQWTKNNTEENFPESTVHQLFWTDKFQFNRTNSFLKIDFWCEVAEGAN